MARIYVSSTFSDLEEYRKQVSLALRRLGHEDVAMEYYVSEDQRPLDRCLSDVASCDVYVGIFAWRYGYVPPNDNPEGRSITELEYRQAQDKNNRKPCLIFLLYDDAPWPRNKQDKGVAADKIEAFRLELSERHSVTFFSTADELARKVNEAVSGWERESGQARQRQRTDWDLYREALRNRHQWVRLQVIAGVSRERGIIKIPLTEVFEPQLVVHGVSPTDVPDEVRAYQKAIYSPRPDGSEDSDEDTPTQSPNAEAPEADIEPESEEILLASNPELVLDLVCRERTQVILGGPGSGKSTVLQHVMLRVCETSAGREALPMHLQDASVPLLIELRRYVLEKENAPDFESYLIKNAANFYAIRLDAESLKTLLAENEPNRALVFFDGLDEVFDPDDRRQVIEQFETFTHRYPYARIVVTSRIAGYERTALGLAGFEHYTLLPLTLGQIRRFADRWYRYYTLEGTERTAQGLVQRIVDSPRLHDLAGNPLLLTMMAVIYKDRDLPNERWRLYERCAETMLEDWDLSKGIQEKDFKLAVLIRTAQKAEILQRVSFYMLEHGQKGRELNAITYQPLLTIIAGYLKEKYQRSPGEAEAVAVDILRHLMERTYVLAGIGERVFGFVHRTFMEYFAACRCQAEFNARKADFTWLTRKIFGQHWRATEWEEVLLLLIAMLHDQGTPIRELIDHLRNNCRTGELPFNVAFAARCLGEAGDVQEPVQGQALLAELAKSIADYGPKRGRRAQAFIKAGLNAFAALAPLVAPPPVVLDSIDRLNSNYATRIIAWQMSFALRSRKERLNHALAALQDSQQQEVVRRAALAALERDWPSRPDIGLVLVEVVGKDRRTSVRLAALAALNRAWPNDPAILDAIARRADKEPHLTYIRIVIEYLAEVWPGNSKALDLIVRLASPRKNDSLIPGIACRALARGWRGDLRALTFVLDCTTVTLDWWSYKRVLRALHDGWTDETNALAFLQRAWTSLLKEAIDDPVPSRRGSALEAIAYGWHDDPEALAFLQDRTTNDPEASRCVHRDELIRVALLSGVQPQ